MSTDPHRPAVLAPPRAAAESLARRNGAWGGRLLALLPDAYGGRGGIATFNRDLLGALASHPSVEGITVLPRLVVDEVGAVPSAIDFDVRAAGGMGAYVRSLVRRTLTDRDIKGVVCGHLNLLPFAAAVAQVRRVPLVLTLHGIEAWSPRRPPSAGRRCTRRRAA